MFTILSRRCSTVRRVSLGIYLQCLLTFQPIKTVIDYFFHVDANKETGGESFVSILNHNIHLFSAVGQNTSRKHYYDNIILNGWEKREAHAEIFTCCLVYNDSLGDIFLTKMIDKRDWSYLGMAKLEVKQYVCPNVFHKQGKAPVGITLSVGKVCPKDMNKYMKVDLPTEMSGERLAVCAKLVYGNLSASAMVEWFEYQRLMGVSKVIAYTYKLSRDAMNVLKYYVVTGLAEFYPYSLPMKGGGIVKDSLSSINMYDMFVLKSHLLYKIVNLSNDCKLNHNILE